jgi:two-component system, cell cycle sensor histidine kinase and response regulator CckA
MTTQELTRQAMDALTIERRGSIRLVLFVAVALITAVSVLMFLGRSQAEPYVLALLAVLGMVGVFSLFATAAGILRVAGKSEGDPAYKRVVDDAFDGIAVTDESGRVVYANAAYRQLVDAHDASDVRPVERVFIGDPDLSEAVYRLLKAAREGRRLQEEVRIDVLPGQPARWLQLRVRPLGVSGPDARHAVWTVADVTRERERQENVFQELQDAIDYLDHAPAGFFSVDGSGHISYVNATLAEWLHYDLAEVGSGGLTLTEVFQGDGAALLPVLGRPGEVKTEVLDIDMRTREGKTLPVRIYHKVAFGADGVPGTSRTLVLNRARDVAHDPQRAAEVQFMRFFHNTPMAIATVDRAGRIARSNALLARMFQTVPPAGRSQPEGGSILAIVAERDRGAVETAISQAAGGQSDVLPVDAALAGEGERWARFFVTAVDDELDQERVIVYTLETTEQRALQKQVDQAQKMDSVGKLAGGIAHDFNNVLSAIMMATDFLLNAHKPTDPSFQDIIQIKQNANRAAALVRQLLAFSRRQTLRPQVLDLGEALSDISMLLRRLIGEKVSLDVKHGRDLWPVKADISQFEQVIVNLAVNARDAMPDGGRLMLRTANISEVESRSPVYKGMPPGDYVLIEVADTGTGISEEIRDRIFEPFFSTKEVGMGTGLGLSTVYGIIKQTGGFIYVDSDVGKGTTFRIFLPRHVLTPDEIFSVPGHAPVAEAARPAPADHTGQGTILLVEDEEGLRGLNARGLASRGYTVCEASNGAEALALIEEGQQVDLVVSDVVMPEMDGPTLLKELRKRDPELKIIFVSGYAEEAFAKNLPEGGQFAFLAKPFTLKQLVATVKETMGS